MLSGFFVLMDIQETIVNKVAQSGLMTVDLADFAPQGERVMYDIKDNLFQGLILREKDFREFVTTHDWRSEEHTSELQSLMRISYAVFCLKKKKHKLTHSSRQSE